MKLFVALSAFVALCTLSGCRHHEIVVERTEAVEPEPDVVVVQEGEPVEGVAFVEPPAVDEYVLIGGRYHYWHPGYHRWVEMRGDFHPGRGYHVRRLNSWHDRPTHEGDVHRRPGKAEDAHRRPGKTEDVHHQPGKTVTDHRTGPTKTPPTKTPPKKVPPKKVPPKDKDKK